MRVKIKIIFRLQILALYIRKTLTIGEPKGTNPETTVNIKFKSNILFIAIKWK